MATIAITKLRQAWRTFEDPETGSLQRVLGLQQWHAAEGWEHATWVALAGFWEDVEIVADYTEGAI